MEGERIFGIKIKKDELLVEFSKPRYRKLGLHLFCNLNIHPTIAEDILLESRWLNDNGFNTLIKKVIDDYKNQPKGYDLLEDPETMTIFKEKMLGWFFENFSLPTDHEVNEAAEIFEIFPDDLHDMLYESIFGSIMANQEDFEKVAEDIPDIYEFVKDEQEEKHEIMRAVHNFAKKFSEALIDPELGGTALSEENSINKKYQLAPGNENVLLGIDDNRAKPKVGYLPSENKEVHYLGIDFSQYPHIEPSFRKQLAQNLFLDINLSPFRIEEILENPKMCSALNCLMEKFDCKIEQSEDEEKIFARGIIGMGYILNKIDWDEYENLLNKFDLNFEDEMDDEQLEEYHKKKQIDSENKLRTLFAYASRLNIWIGNHPRPPFEELAETLMLAEIDFSDVVCIRYLTENYAFLYNYPLAASNLMCFMNKYRQWLEDEEINSLLDYYLILLEQR